MTKQSDEYLFSSSQEAERLQMQSRVWEDEAEALFDRIGVQRGWHCADLGCGAMGVLGCLSRRVGDTGRVIGVELDPQLVAAAQAYIQAEDLSNAEVFQGDAYRTELPSNSFDLTHMRFVLAPVGRNEEMLHEMLSLTRPGGVIVLEEPVSDTFYPYPPNAAWGRLVEAIYKAAEGLGGDFYVGKRLYALLRQGGLEDVQVRPVVKTFRNGHPYMRLPIIVASQPTLRQRIIDMGLMSAEALDETISEVERMVQDPEVLLMSFVLMQVWGRKPQSS
jgi:ubiquinone/menaquinone biosynthesis C-methylase UbiE